MRLSCKRNEAISNAGLDDLSSKDGQPKLPENLNE